MHSKSPQHLYDHAFHTDIPYYQVSSSVTHVQLHISAIIFTARLCIYKYHCVNLQCISHVVENLCAFFEFSIS